MSEPKYGWSKLTCMCSDVHKQLSASQAREAELREKLKKVEALLNESTCELRTQDENVVYWKQRTEAVEAKIKASQEPI